MTSILKFYSIYVIVFFLLFRLSLGLFINRFILIFLCRSCSVFQCLLCHFIFSFPSVFDLVYHPHLSPSAQVFTYLCSTYSASVQQCLVSMSSRFVFIVWYIPQDHLSCLIHSVLLPHQTFCLTYFNNIFLIESLSSSRSSTFGSSPLRTSQWFQTGLVVHEMFW